jgi:hypothetical protein
MSADAARYGRLLNVQRQVIAARRNMLGNALRQIAEIDAARAAYVNGLDSNQLAPIFNARGAGRFLQANATRKLAAQKVVEGLTRELAQAERRSELIAERLAAAVSDAEFAATEDLIAESLAIGQVPQD